MPEITKMTPRRRETWLEIETAEESLRLPVTHVPAGLFAGLNISEAQWAELRVESEYYLLRDKAVSLLARREHFRRELEIKLSRQTRDREMVQRVLDDCEDQGYINSRRAAELTVQMLLNRGGLGTMRIRQELIKRGCPREILAEVLEETVADRDELGEMTALLQSRVQSLRSRLRRSREKLVKKGVVEARLERELSQQMQAAIMRLLNGRGFRGDQAYKLAAKFTEQLLDDRNKPPGR